jgi:hypothetical protein
MNRLHCTRLLRRASALHVVVITTFALSTSVRAAADTQLPTESPPPSAADAKVRIWTVILIDGQTKEPLERIPVEFCCWKSGHREPQRMTFTSGSGGELKIPLAAGTSTPLHFLDRRWWTYDYSTIGSKQQAANEAEPSADSTKPITIRLWQGTEVRGQLLKPDATPAGGMILNLTASITGPDLQQAGLNNTRFRIGGREFPNWHTSVVTAADGTFAIAAPPQSFRSWLSVGTVETIFGSGRLREILGENKALLEYAPLKHEVKPSNGNESLEVLDLGKLLLRSGVVLKGRVLDVKGNPLAGVGVLINNQHGPFSGHSTRSAADGTYQLRPVEPGSVGLFINGRRETDQGTFASNDVQAVFVQQQVVVPEGNATMNLDLHAAPHILLEFDWIDRRLPKDRAKFARGFRVSGVTSRPGEPEFPWWGDTTPTTRDGRDIHFVKIPTTLSKAVLTLWSDEKLLATYEDDQTKPTAHGVELGDVTKPRRRIIYGDAPTTAKK